MKKFIAVIAFAAAPFLFGQQKSVDAANLSAQSVEKVNKSSVEEAKLAEIKADKERKVASENASNKVESKAVNVQRADAKRAKIKSATSLKD